MTRLTIIFCLAAPAWWLAPELSKAATATRAEGQGAAGGFNAHAVDAELAQRRQRLVAALNAFDAWIASAESRNDWREYVQWDEWAAPILASSDWRPYAMRPIAKRFYAPQEGLDAPSIIELREALAAYLEHDEAARAAGKDAAGEYGRRLDALRKASAASPVDFAALESAAWWLAAMGQAPDELAKVRARFSGPIVVGQISRKAIEAKLNEFEHKSQSIKQTRNRIQGASVVGTSTVQSNSSPALFDAPTDARLRVTTRGTVSSPHNVASSGRVTVSSSSTSQFTAIADVYWTGQGFAATEPQVDVDMRSSITGINAPLLVRRAAARRVQGGRASAEAEGEAIIRNNIAKSMSQRLKVTVAKLDAKVGRLMRFLASTGNSADRWATRVRPTAVQIGYTPPTMAGIGAEPHNPPPLAEGEGIGLSLHDTAIETVLRPQLAGAEWTDVDFARMQREITGGNEEEFMIGLDPHRWSVQWSWRAPIQIHFTADHAEITYRFSRVEIDGSEYRIPFEVTADVDAIVTPNGLGFSSREPAVVTAMTPGEMLPPHFQSLLERKFRALITPLFYLDTMQFPAGGAAFDPLSGYRPSGISFEPNWVHIRYTNQHSDAADVAKADAWKAERDGASQVARESK